MIDKAVGDNAHWREEEAASGFEEVSFKTLWNIVTPKYRAEILNKSSSVDVGTKNLIELADFMSRACLVFWGHLPGWLQKGLEHEFIAAVRVSLPGTVDMGFYDRQTKGEM